MAGLTIPSHGALDLVSLGALVHRIDPGVVPFRKATHAQIHVSGGEFNVAANLADAFELSTAIVSAMVDYPIGDLVAERVRAMGVKPFYKRYPHDGVSGPNIATVYSDRGHGVRPPVVFYNRANEAAALLAPGDVDWQGIFAGGVRWFHSGGIFASLSESTGQLIVEGMQAARKAGAVTSFDLNFREKLWNVWGGKHKAAEVVREIVEHVDVLFGSVDVLLGAQPAPAPDVKLEPAAVFATIEQVIAKYPRLKSVATTLRDVHSTNRHTFSALGWHDGHPYLSPSLELDVLDRVGSGDGFAAGFIYGLLSGESPQMAINLGWAHGALLTTFPGDTSMATVQQVRDLALGGSARIQR
jgi:2-dehydro-3-deoxygluconokinase